MPFPDPFDLEEFHKSTLAKVNKGVRGYAIGEIGGHVVSLHPISEGSEVMTITTSSTFLSYREARDKLIDGMVKTPPTTQASPGTFLRDDYEDRARYFEKSYIFSGPTAEDKAFAAKLRVFAGQL